jgi:acetate kinase
MADMILTLNAGSSSVKFALYGAGGEPEERARGQVEGIGTAPRLSVRAGARALADRAEPGARDHPGALAAVLGLIEEAFAGAGIRAVGHRIVHGGAEHAGPAVLDAGRLAALARLVPFAPLHQPHNLEGVRAAAEAFPDALQVGCFDTAFHRTQPRVNETYALPRHFYEEGVRRYGFHGLSYEHVAGRLREVAPALAAGRAVVAHLGNGASVCGLSDGRSTGCSMGFSPLDGVPMGTRSGQLDPGVVLHLIRREGMGAEEVSRLLWRGSGLLGLSGLSNDMRALEAAATEAALHAIHHFALRAAREIAAMAVLAGGLDAVVFTGGIGEHAAAVRGRIAEGLGWAGLVLDPGRNRASETLISAEGSAVAALVIPTDEERTIARAAARLLAAG